MCRPVCGLWLLKREHSEERNAFQSTITLFRNYSTTSKTSSPASRVPLALRLHVFMYRSFHPGRQFHIPGGPRRAVRCTASKPSLSLYALMWEVHGLRYTAVCTAAAPKTQRGKFRAFQRQSDFSNFEQYRFSTIVCSMLV